jgi:hypothetical protein
VNATGRVSIQGIKLISLYPMVFNAQIRSVAVGIALASIALIATGEPPTSD